jgi:IS30 family transposase
MLTNKNTNRLLREYLPRYTDLSVYSESKLDWIATELNERPRKTLDYETPADRFNACVATIG